MMWSKHGSAGSADAGFTLVEMLTSVGLLVVVLSAAWLLLTTSGDNLNRVGNGSQAGEANRAAMEALGRDITHGVVPPSGASPILGAEPARLAILADEDVDGDGQAELVRVVWEADDTSHTLFRSVTEATDAKPQPESEADFEGGVTTTSTVLTGLADPSGDPLFVYYAGSYAGTPTTAAHAADVGLVKVHLRNGLPTPTMNVVDRTSAFRVVAFVINGY